MLYVTFNLLSSVEAYPFGLTPGLVCGLALGLALSNSKQESLLAQAHLVRLTLLHLGKYEKSSTVEVGNGR